MAAPYEEHELIRARTLRECGYTWREVGQALDRPYRSLEITYSLYRRGRWQAKRRFQATREKDAQCESLVESGVITLREIAARVGICPTNACRRLARMGLDAEMRRLAVDTARDGA